MDFIAIIADLSGPTKIILSSLAFVALMVAFIAYDIERNAKSDLLERQKDGAQMIDNYELIKMVRGSDHCE